MELKVSPVEFREACERARSAGSTVGLVPTMGSLHQGHARLIKQAKAECGFVAVSIFVNPLQFDSPGDLEAYPRALERDRAIAQSLGCDLVFAPAEDEMYPRGEPVISVDPGPLGTRLEGASRPGHFRGVLTIVAKLLNLTGPCRAYFGEKDAQQLALVRRMVVDLDFPVAVVAGPTVREIDGLALSSRNSRLSTEQRAAATVLFNALSTAAAMVRQGERRSAVIRAEMAKRIGAEPVARLDYVTVVDDGTWEEVENIDGPARALVAARFGETRLIDNLPLPWEATTGAEGSG